MNTQELLSEIKSKLSLLSNEVFDIEQNETNYDLVRNVAIDGEEYKICFDVTWHYTASEDIEGESYYEFEIHWINLGEKEIYHVLQDEFLNLAEILKP